MRKLIWFLLVLAVLALGADRGADWLAERTVASKVQSSQDLRSTPDVDIAGFPFLTQLARKHFDEVTAHLTDVDLGQGSRAVVLSEVDLTFVDVRTDRRFTTFHAATGRARATLPYDELGRVLDLDVSYAGRGRIKARKAFTVAGQKLTPTVTVEPTMLDGALTFTNSTLDEGLPAPVARALRDAFDLEVPLQGLPFKVRATSLTADEAGVEISLVGKDLSYLRP